MLHVDDMIEQYTPLVYNYYTCTNTINRNDNNQNAQKRQDEIMNNELKSTQNHYKYMYLHNTDI